MFATIKILFWGLVLGMATWWLTIKYIPPAPVQQVPTAAASSPLPKYPTVEIDGVTIAYGLLPVPKSATLELIPNYEERAEATQLVAQNACRSAVSGGFYAQDFRPLGLVVAAGRRLSPARNSQLFNGYLVVSKSGQAAVGRRLAQLPFIAVQSGPLLLEGRKALALNLSADRQARRIVGAVTDSADLVFMAVFDPRAETLGPRLFDLPRVVKAVSDRESLRITDALNLDGGSASLFYSPTLRLEATDPVGAIFCLH